jgi:hypothetical protein
VAHPEKVRGFDSLDDLAREVGNLRYDSLAEFLGKLAQDIKQQAEADAKRGRPILSAALYQTADKIEDAKAYADKAWKISDHYMK